MNTIALVCVAILGALLFGLGMAVSGTRFQAQTVSGCPPDPTNRLTKLVRAHGNTAEYAPFFAVLFLYLGAHNPSQATVVLIVAATAARCLIVAGLLAWPSMAKPNPARFIGGVGTYACGIALCITLFRVAMGG
jgi:uncharacterized membrane protein YecN with MAPEG domain